MELFNKAPHELKGMFVGVIDYESTKLIGWLEDAVGIDIAAVELQDPLEFVATLNDGGIVNVNYFYPEAGLAKKVVHSTDCLSVHPLDSGLGKSYFNVLKGFQDASPRMQYKVGTIYKRDSKQERHSGHYSAK